MKDEQSKKFNLVIGIITYGATTAPYLSLFRESLSKQTYQDFQVIIHDNTEKNLGFAVGYNELIERARGMGARYFLVINPDVYLLPDALEKLVRVMEREEGLGSVAPKLLRWNFSSNTFSTIIDSCGLGLSWGLSFYDIGQGEEDSGQYDRATLIGPSGAAGLFRISALEQIAENGNYFDETFFMYKEDCDLAYRLRQKNLQSRLVPQAIGYHDRTAVGGSLVERWQNRRKRSRLVNQWSFTNQHLLFIKHWQQQNFFERILIIVRALIIAVNALMFEQYLLPCYKQVISYLRS